MEIARRVSERVAHEEWDLVWQSRSGPPTQPWLEPDILDHLRALAENGVRDVVVSPLGFLSDHMEVMYDLDHEAAALCRDLGLNFVRAQTPGTHPADNRHAGRPDRRAPVRPGSPVMRPRLLPRSKARRHEAH